MNPFKISGICLSILVLSGCGSDPEPVKAPPPPVVDNVDRMAPVELKIPGVGDDVPSDVDVLKMPEQGTELGNGTVTDAIQGAGQDVPPAVSTLDMPRPLLLSDAVHSRFSSLLEGPTALPILDAVLYPLGWSKDGKFAYAIEPPDEAVGSYFLNVYVQDLVTDKVLWQDKYQSPPESNKGFHSFAAYWATNETSLLARLKKFDIELTPETVLYAGAINYENDQVDYAVKKSLKGQPDFGNLAMVSNYQVDVSSATRGKKTVHKETYKAPLSVLDVDVIGYLRSDDPERVALLVGGVRRGWEGPPHVTWYQVIGANLKLGFKK